MLAKSTLSSIVVTLLCKAVHSLLQLMGISAWYNLLPFSLLFPCRELKAARLAQTLMKDQPLGNANLQESETSPKKNNKRLVGGKNCRSFSFTVGYWTSVVWKALAAEWHWEHRLCTDECPMLALLVIFVPSLTMVRYWLRKGKNDELSSVRCDLRIFSSALMFSCVTGLVLD